MAHNELQPANGEARFRRPLAAAARFGALLAAALAAACQTAPQQRAAGEPASPGPREAILTLAPMLERVTPAVVNISVEAVTEAELPPVLQDPQVRRFFGIPDDLPEQREMSVGSGVIFDAGAGYVVTNAHVVAGADHIWVTLKDGRVFDAVPIGADPQTDLAVLQIDAGSLQALPFADSDEVRVGDYAFAIGNPFGLGQSVSNGIVSGLGRAGLIRDGYEDFIQTDAPINPGNSGGALVNSRGDLIGINSAILSRTGGNIGIGFAIPSNIAANVVSQLIDAGTVERGQLGIVVTDIDQELIAELDLDVYRGAVVTDVRPGSAAADAPLAVGDVITGVNGHSVDSAAALRSRIGLMHVGDQVNLTVIRQGRETRVSTRLSPPS
ncbi:MAG: trypsin-like peptidase domain-containing protein [Alphaproteobacteria bacterium]